MIDVKFRKTLIFIYVAFGFPNSICDSRSVSLNQKQEICYSQNKVYHPGSDKCYKLLTIGPCESGYWFVLEKPNGTIKYQDLKISGICAPEKCPDGDYYWEKTRSCIQRKNKEKLCGDSANEELLNNFFGEAECKCKRDPLRVRFNGEEKNKCYQLHTQGPCRTGEVVGFASNDDKAKCIQDKCYLETMRKKLAGMLSAQGVLAPWINGSCYELGTQGPCADTHMFKVHESSLRPDCVMLTNAIFDLEKPQDCFQDENGDCQKKINKSQNPEKYKQELFSALNAARKKRGFSY